MNNGARDDGVRVEKIVSGGQTGADRAALDAAFDLGLDVGGWCPRGRRAEDARIDQRYPLQETPSKEYAERTTWNVRDSDGTLILAAGELIGGTVLTLEEAGKQGKPHLVVDPSRGDVGEIRRWLRRHGIRTLNVAGPRASEDPGIYRAVYDVIRRLLAE